MGFDDVFTIAFWARLAVAVLCGGLLGLERQVRGKPAGIRTSIMICLGSMLFMYLGRLLEGNTGDPTRVLGQIVTGIGFLGAGVILTSGGHVHGVTSASVIWVLAGVGATVASGYFAVAIVVTLVAVVLLIGIEYIEQGFQALRRGVHAHGGEHED